MWSHDQKFNKRGGDKSKHPAIIVKKLHPKVYKPQIRVNFYLVFETKFIGMTMGLRNKNTMLC